MRADVCIRYTTVDQSFRRLQCSRKTIKVNAVMDHHACIRDTHVCASLRVSVIFAKHRHTTFADAGRFLAGLKAIYMYVHDHVCVF